MQTIGIICEYNPFHNGHIYHIKKTKDLFPDSLIILILNGYFTERAEVSIISKFDKVAIALEYNIDLVVELPAIFGTQSADTFASKSIEILNELKIDTIVFGSESNNLETLMKIAQNQLTDSNYDAKVKKYLKEKNNYPTALAKALNIPFNYNNPNDLLAISYLKAILQINPNIKPVSIQRTSQYHDIQSKEEIVSATNIRTKLKKQEDITKYLPKIAYKNIKNINEDLLFTLLKYKIKTCADLSVYLDIDEGIENRLVKFIDKTNSLEDLIKSIKSKRYTYNKINRMLLHILLDFKKTDNLNNLEYIRILGFNQKGQTYLNKIKKEITKPLNPVYNSQTYKLEQKAIFLYDLLTNSQEKERERKNKPLIK